MAVLDAPIDLGEDIILYGGCDHGLLARLSSRQKFLDVLWLPCNLAELRPEQIFVINRFREREIGSDAQFKMAMRSRQALLSVIRSSGAEDVTEIGCGKFPLSLDLGKIRYRAIEIDPEAEGFCRSIGVCVLTRPLQSNSAFKSNLFVSLYAMHFAIDPYLVEFIASRLSEGGCIMFNAIVDDSTAMLAKLKMLTTVFPIVQIVKEACLAKREFFFVLARGSDAPAAALLAKGLSQCLCEHN